MTRGGYRKGAGRKTYAFLGKEKVQTADIRIHICTKNKLSRCKGKTFSEKIENLINFKNEIWSTNENTDSF